jgi:hypothetical protein
VGGVGAAAATFSASGAGAWTENKGAGWRPSWKKSAFIGTPTRASPPMPSSMRNPILRGAKTRASVERFFLGA